MSFRIRAPEVNHNILGLETLGSVFGVQQINSDTDPQYQKLGNASRESAAYLALLMP